MASVVAGMTVSLDGFVADADGNPGALYTDLEHLRDSDYMAELTRSAGAVLMGRRTFEMTDDPDTYADGYEYQLPIFVVTSRPPARHPKESDRLTFTFVTDGLVSAVEQARAAAGDREVHIVGGPRLGGALLAAGLVDELWVDVMPVLLGSGTRLFDDPALAGVRLEKINVSEYGQRTSLRFRVVRS